MAWIICPNEICGERFALSDDTEAFARAHEGLRLVCPFGHAIWPFPATSEAAKPAEAEKPKTRAKRVLPVTEAEQAALDEPEGSMAAKTPEAVAEEAKEAAELMGLVPQQDAPADAGPEALSTSATTATSREASSEEPTGQDGTAPTASPSEVVSEGYPNENEVYMLNGDEWTFNAERGEERRDTYKNGEPFSDAGRDKGYKIYEDHAPASAQAGAEPEDLPAELKALIDAAETVETWDAVKAAMGTFQKTALWPTLSPDQQNHIRRSTWDTLADRNLSWLPDHDHDLSAFRLWVEAQDEPAAIKASLALLQADPAAQAKASALQSVSDAAAARIKDLAE